MGQLWPKDAVCWPVIESKLPPPIFSFYFQEGILSGEVAIECSIQILSKTITSSLLSASTPMHVPKSICRAFSWTSHVTRLPYWRGNMFVFLLYFSESVLSMDMFLCKRLACPFGNLFAKAQVLYSKLLPGCWRIRFYSQYLTVLLHQCEWTFPIYGFPESYFISDRNFQ